MGEWYSLVGCACRWARMLRTGVGKSANASTRQLPSPPTAPPPSADAKQYTSSPPTGMIRNVQPEPRV
jgi:hypothetical protein